MDQTATIPYTQWLRRKGIAFVEDKYAPIDNKCWSQYLHPARFSPERLVMMHVDNTVMSIHEHPQINIDLHTRSTITDFYDKHPSVIPNHCGLLHIPVSRVTLIEYLMNRCSTFLTGYIISEYLIELDDPHSSLYTS